MKFKQRRQCFRHKETEADSTLLLLCKLLLPSHRSWHRFSSASLLDNHCGIWRPQGDKLFNERKGDEWYMSWNAPWPFLFSPGQVKWFLRAGLQGKGSPRDFIKLLLLQCHSVGLIRVWFEQRGGVSWRWISHF